MTAAGFRSRRYSAYALGLLAAVNFLNYGNRNVLFSMYGDLRRVFAFSDEALGLLGTAFMAAHAVMTPIVGWAGDRFDRRRIIAAGLFLWSLAAVASALAVGLIDMLISRALVGAGTAACVPVAVALLCDAFPEERKARITSIFNIGLFLGGAVGFGLGAGLGYPAGILTMALPGIFLALLVARLEVPSEALPRSTLSLKDYLRRATQLFRMPAMRWIALGATLMAFAAGGYLAWFFEFLLQVKGLKESTAFSLFGACLIGGLAGVVSGGVVGDRLQRRVPYGRLAAASIGMACTAPSALLAIYLDVGIPFYLVAWLTLYFASWYHGPIAAVIDDLATDDRAATAQAFVIFLMHLLGTAPASWAVGRVSRLYDLQTAMLVPTAIVLVAALVLLAGFRSAGRSRTP